MKNKILFYDSLTPFTYSFDSIKQMALGGTEATIARIANGLKDTHEVFVAQHCRSNQENTICNGVQYISTMTARKLKPEIVVLLRDVNILRFIAEQFPQARHFFWMHNFPPRDFNNQLSILADHHFEIISVSQIHKQMIYKRLQGNLLKRWFSTKKCIPIHTLHNPIDESLCPNDTHWDPNQLIFMSSQYKGLTQVLKKFSALRTVFPEYELKIAAHGKWESMVLPPHTVYLGGLPFERLMEEVRKSFCVFYPQTKRAETFGLIYAEANAVGTPVLAHDFGAAKEVLSHPCQLINGHRMDSIINKIRDWRNERPRVKAKPEFGITNIINNWNKILTVS